MSKRTKKEIGGRKQMKDITDAGKGKIQLELVMEPDYRTELPPSIIIVHGRKITISTNQLLF